MTDQKDEKALAALLAKILAPDAQAELTKDELEEFLNENVALTPEEAVMLAGIDVTFPRTGKRNIDGGIIEFPGTGDGLKVVGLDRKGKKYAPSTQNALDKKRSEIIQRLERQEKDDCDTDADQ